MSLTRNEIISQLGILKEKLAEKEPIRDKADIELMKMKCEIKELKNKQAAFKKQLKDLPKPQLQPQQSKVRSKKSKKNN